MQVLNVRSLSMKGQPLTVKSGSRVRKTEQKLKLNHFKTSWLLYAPTGLTSVHSAFCPRGVCMCFICISEQAAIISVFTINRLVFITKRESVYCAVRTESINILVLNFNNCPTRCDLFSLSYFCRQLYMFRVLTPIIRSSYNCNYSFWYRLTGYTTIRSRC